MRRILFSFVLVVSPLILSCSRTAEAEADLDVEDVDVAATDWPWWRGPTRNGVAAPGQKIPLKWSDTDNVVWKAPLPGRGHSSPTVVGNRVFVATAEESPDRQSVLCFDRKSGKQLWQTVVHKGGFVGKGNERSTQASSSVACDGKRIFINFTNTNAVYTTALDLDGKQLWQTKIADYVLHQGYGASPAIYQHLVIATADNKGGKGVVAGLNRKTGKIVWTQPRPKEPNYPSPIILRINDLDQLLLTGCGLVTSMNPLTGKKHWEVKGATTECVTSTVTDGKHVFSSGGYPKNHMSAVVADGSGKLAWENGTRIYVPSMVIRDGYLYGVLDAGFAACWNSDTGKEVWRQRLKGTFSSSLVLIGDMILATNESGRSFLYKATPDGYKSLGENQLGNEAFATPAVCGDQLFFRVASTEQGKRQEMLYCIGTKKAPAP